MSSRWNLVNTPPALLDWILEQPWFLGQSPDGIVTVGMAVHPDQILWAVSAISAINHDPNNHSDQVWYTTYHYTTYNFRVDHQTNTLTFTHTTRSRAQ